ncbi:MAG: acyl-CoA thioesterase [Armatimonadetes bacterium]|nr:acyl-CoA thioesterase [Armatimonadota bacterium]
MPERFTVEEHVRWSDTDPAGILYYGQYNRFIEIAETELFRFVGLPYSVMFDELNIWLPRVQIHFDFFHPLRLDDLIRISAYVGHFGTSSFTLRFEVHKQTALAAAGHVVLACVDRSTFRARPLPERLVAGLKPYLESKNS